MPVQQGGGVSSLFRDDERVVGPAEAWAIVNKGRKLILFAIAAGLLTAILVTLFAEPQYRAVVVLNVERDTGRFFEVGSESQSYTFYDPQFFATQTRLMRSREVAERVIKRLNLLGNPELAPPRSRFFRLFAGGVGTSSGDLSNAARSIQAYSSATSVSATNLVDL